jgi:hypothetical protein
MRALRYLPFLVLALAASIAAAAPPAVETAGPPPAELAAALRSELVPEGVKAGGLEVWPRSSPSLGEAREGLGIAFGRLTPGALAGVVRLASDWTDYKGQKIAAGLYSLRYAIEPADGNHMGVSAWRDFFLLVPAADDPGPATVPGPDDLYALSTKASHTHHPATLALFPADRVEKPAGTVNEAGQPTLAIPFGELTLGIVVEGKGEV